MKEKLKICLVLLVGAGLTLPYLSLAAKQSPASLADAPASSAAVQNTQGVRVVAASTSFAEITVQKKSAESMGCGSAAGAANDLVQGSVGINFNAPGGCFDIALNPVVRQSKLQVRPLAGALPEVKVSYFVQPIISSASLASAPVLPENQALPLVFAIGIISAAAYARRLPGGVNLKTGGSFRFVLTLSRLQIMRC